jgi:hypothetical protein
LRALHLNEAENLFHGSRDYTSLWVASWILEALHSVSLAGTSLSIG